MCKTKMSEDYSSFVLSWFVETDPFRR